ncbi:hypothetical protein CTEN210_09099 [Chaetoceros tenuissimus]|uniref:Leucine-rich repeat-containing N-terminal plant-type domain-containing protein n=1 Tax=Chaetoceros tenuissimus TaxID=426638 RepID=A0AAD3H7A0_9STRA|nr:hypothetical protein CTEN210_09099 [Chaetoceros tenuissimus]
MSVAEASKSGTRNMNANNEWEKVNQTKKPKKCKKTVGNYFSNGSQLGDIIAAMVKEQDFSAYCRDDFEIAESWFLDMANHPADGAYLNDNEYMKERLILALTYSANCKDGCKLQATINEWLSTKDHCQLEGVTCNNFNKISEMKMGFKGLSGNFTMFGMKSLQELNLSWNDLSSTCTVAGESPNVNEIDLSHNMLADFVGGQLLTNLDKLYLHHNEFTGKFIITWKDFPPSLKILHLGKNKLRGFTNGGKYLKNLEFLSFSLNQFSGEFIITAKDFPTSLKTLSLRYNKITSFRNGGDILKNLLTLDLEQNDFSGNLIITQKDFPTSIYSLYLNGNKLTGFSNGGEVLKNLLILELANNKFAHNFVVTAKNIPTSIERIGLGGNKLTGFIDGGKILTNLEHLSLQRNLFTDDLTITPNNFPQTLKSLHLHRNKLERIIDAGKFLTKLESLDLSENSFQGDMLITVDHFPSSLKGLLFDSNSGLTKIDADDDAVLSLDYITVRNIASIEVGQELCSRSSSGSLDIYPSNVCS